ncbi:hypothetical protein CRX72_16840 [Pantoea sp. BRM17]|nr:hypothetical protein CRX72_16840 [Pantoea sp. BRM17]
MSESGAQDASASSDKPCALSAKSLSASTPVFDAALLLLMLVMALVATALAAADQPALSRPAPLPVPTKVYTAKLGVCGGVT